MVPCTAGDTTDDPVGQSHFSIRAFLFFGGRFSFRSPVTSAHSCNIRDRLSRSPHIPHAGYIFPALGTPRMTQWAYRTCGAYGYIRIATWHSVATFAALFFTHTDMIRDGVSSTDAHGGHPRGTSGHFPFDTDLKLSTQTRTDRIGFTERNVGPRAPHSSRRKKKREKREKEEEKRKEKRKERKEDARI